MKNHKKQAKMTFYYGLFTMILLSSFHMNCSICKSRSATPAMPSAKDYYEMSQNELTAGEHSAAYSDYQKAVGLDNELTDLGLMYEIIFSWAELESQPEDSLLLAAQKKVRMAPMDIESRKALLKLAVNEDTNVIRIFGIGRAPENVASAAVKKSMAGRAAFMDANAWVARLTSWKKDGVEGSFDVSAMVSGVTKVDQISLGEQIVVTKVEAVVPAP